MSVSRKAPNFRVHLDGVVDATAQVHQITRGVGSAGEDTATIEFRVPQSQATTQFQDAALRDFFLDKVVYIDANHIGEPTTSWFPKFWGRTTGARCSFSDDGEHVLVECKTVNEMIAQRVGIENLIAVLDRTKNNTSIAETDRTVAPSDFTPTFNPIIDGLATPNMFAVDTPPETDHQPAFIDPDSIDQIALANDRIGAAAIANYWSLSDIAQYLMQWFKTDDITLPAWSVITGVLGTDRNIIRNERVKIGEHSVDALSRILLTYGYGWKLVHTDISTHTIEFFSRVTPSTTVFFLQRWQEPLNNANSEVKTLQVNVDGYSRSSNVAIAWGSRPQYEISIELFPAWSVAYDLRPGTTPNDLTLNSDAWKALPDLRDAWRKWAANEGSDYTGLRPWFTEAPNLSVIDTAFLDVKRRKVLPNITANLDNKGFGKTPPGVHLEYWNPDTSTWKPVLATNNTDKGMDHGQHSVVDDEIAIWFSSKEFPRTLYAISQKHGLANTKLRLTCSIETDSYLRGLSSIPANERFVAEDVQELYFQDKQFPKLSVYTGVNFASILAGTTGNSREVDSTAAVQALADRKIDMSRDLFMSGRVEIEGVDRDMEERLGKAVSIISDRGLDFNRANAAVAGRNRFPNISSYQLDVQRNRTYVTLEEYRRR